MEGQKMKLKMFPGLQKATEKKQPINMHQDIGVNSCSKGLDPSSADLKSSL